MSTVNSEDLEVLVKSKDGRIKEYRTQIDKICLADDKDENFVHLKKQLISCVVIEESLSKSLASFIELKTHYNNHSGYYHNSLELAPHALFTHGCLFYRACFVDGRLVGRPWGNIGIKIDDKEIHQLLKDYIDKKIAHIDKNHEVKERDITISLGINNHELTINSVNMRGSEVCSYDIKTLEHIMSYISKIQENVVQRKKELLDQLKLLVGSVTINQK